MLSKNHNQKITGRIPVFYLQEVELAENVSVDDLIKYKEWKTLPNKLKSFEQEKENRLV